MFDKEANKILDYFDELSRYPTTLSKISNLILDASDWFSATFTSPIVIDIGNNGVELVSVDKGVNFDIDADGFAEKTGWVKPSDGILVRDLNRNGVIDSQKEMFGTDRASTAAAKLKALDMNKDGFVDARDSGFSTLRLWRDLNQDGVSQANELFTLASQGVGKLATAVTDTNTTSAGNILDWKSTWYKANGTVGGNFYDVLFETRNEDSWFVGSDTTKTPTINPDTLLLPLSRGYGVVKSLHLTASENATILADLRAIETLKLSDLAKANSIVSKLLFDWSGVAGVKPESGGKFYNQQLIAFMEKLFDYDFKVAPGTRGAGQDYPGLPVSTSELSNEWGMVWQELKTRVLVQGPLQPVFDEAYYSFSEDKVVFGQSLSTILARAKSLKPSTGSDAYWQEIGLALIVNADQFGGNITTIKNALNTAAGKTIPIYENWLKGQARDEEFEGSDFSDLIDLGIGNDTVTAGKGDDAVLGGTGNDTLYGETGNDTLTGGIGADSLVGGLGSDTYNFAKGGGGDTVKDFGGNDSDRIVISGYSSNAAIFSRVGNTNDLLITFRGSNTDKILVDDGLEEGRGSSDTVETVTIGGITKTVAALRAEVLAKQTTAGNDIIVGWGWLANTISGAGGNDAITGGALSDRLKGDDGNDTLVGNYGNDTLTGGRGNDTLRGGFGSDIYAYAKGDGSDTIQDSGSRTEADRLSITGYTMSQAGFARVGNTDDLLVTFAGSKTDMIRVLDGLENGNDTLELVTIDGTSKTVATLRAEVLLKQATNGSDTIVGFEDFSNVIKGGSGNDALIGGAAADRLEGGIGADKLNGGGGSDVLVGGTGGDTFVFNYLDSGIGKAADHIADFSRTEGDKINLHRLGVDASDFVGTGALSKTADSFGYVLGKDAAGKKITTILIDTDHDGKSDQNIILDNVHLALKTSDFTFV